MELPSPRFNSRPLVFYVTLLNMCFMAVLTDIREQMTKENQSAFEINENGAFMILAIVALLAGEVTYWLLLCTTISPHRFTVFKFISIFSASLAPASLGMVLLHSPQNDLTLYLLGYVIFAIKFAHSCSVADDAEIVKRCSFINIVAYLGLVLVPLALILALFAPENLDPTVHLVINLISGVEALCFLSLGFKFMILYDEKQELENFEGYHVIKIQRGENNDLEAHLVS